MSDLDLPLARALLDGLVKQDKRGRLRQQYLRADSPNEADARLALARLLRSDGELDRQLRKSLAELFDPKPPTRQQRKLAFVFRHEESARTTLPTRTSSWKCTTQLNRAQKWLQPLSTSPRNIYLGRTGQKALFATPPQVRFAIPPAFSKPAGA